MYLLDKQLCSDDERGVGMKGIIHCSNQDAWFRYWHCVPLQEKIDKKIENEVTFKTWKEQKDETLKNKIRQKKAEEKKAEEKKKEELEKKRDAEMVCLLYMLTRV